MAALPGRICFTALFALSVLSSVSHASASSHDLPAAHIYNHVIKRQLLGIAASDSATAAATAPTVSATNTAATTSATNSAANPTSAAAATSASTTTQGQAQLPFSSLGAGVSSVSDPSSAAVSHTTISAASSSSSSSASRDRLASSEAVVTSTSGGNVLTSTSFVAASTSSAAAASASASNDQSDSNGIGIGKGTLIGIAVIASIVGAISAVWTIIRKWKLSPSRRFERKLESVDGDENFRPRPPSFAEKRSDYYSTAPAHYRDPSLVNSDHSLSTAYPAMPPPVSYGYAEGHHDPNVHQHEGVQQPSSAVGVGLRRSNSIGSGGGAYGGGFKLYSPDPVNQQPYNNFPASAFDLHVNPSVSDPTFRALSPGAGAFRSPSPGRPAQGAGGAGFPIPMRMASPALAAPPIGVEFDNQTQQSGYGTGYDHQAEGQPGLQRSPTVLTSIPYGGGRVDPKHGGFVGFEPLPPVSRVGTPLSFTAKAGTEGMPLPGQH